MLLEIEVMLLAAEVMLLRAVTLHPQMVGELTGTGTFLRSVGAQASKARSTGTAFSLRKLRNWIYFCHGIWR